MTWQIIEHPTLIWPFHRTDGPYSHHGDHQIIQDPCPAYPHQREDVLAGIALVNKVRLPLMPIKLVLLDHEEMARTNGQSYYGRRQDYDEATKKSVMRDQWDCWIILSAKRIPPHPAMTRYLVAHEFAHHIEDWVSKIHGVTDDVLKKEYAELRGLPEAGAYAAGHWHEAWGEVFANDWRILVANVESEFWPHEGIVRPEKAKGIKLWWKKAMVDLEKEYQRLMVVKA
jgi:hypothetical protein